MIVAAGLAVFMASVDLSITNVTLPTLGRTLGFAQGAALATIVWTVSGSGLGGIRAGLLLLLAITGCGALVVAFVRSAPHRNTAPSTVAPVTAQEERDAQMLVK